MSTERAKKKRRVLFVTAIRSEYDILYSVMRAVDERPETETNLVVTGAHLSELYGNTADLVELDGFEVVGRFETLLNSDSAAGRVKSLAIEIMGLVDVLDRARPDIVIAMGDREDALAVATTAAYMSIPVAHIGGGDHADDGNIDNSIRHAVTKLSHLHFATTERSAKKILDMGEEEWRVNVVGAPGLDRLLTTKDLSKKEIGDYLEFDIESDRLLVVIQHSISVEIEEAGMQMQKTLEAVSGLEIPTLVGYPNSDAGSHRIIDVINDFARRHPFIRPYKGLPRNIFVNILRHADVLVGNSSAGIIEAPLLKLPVINIGARQRNREHAENVIFVDFDLSEIREALNRALSDKDFLDRVSRCENPYGDGHAGEKIAKVLAETKIDRRLIEKKITY
ncbi:MAG: UDP-N-acetylglucosamine 2-epimerase (hydrolyzing) [Deltaproteobacteria bacterium]|uniref:UDP-N-acetylglucosamine 2-epimerase (Hydrolyzing) n=1 Tax=Candidatus Zymogenus saltonus TaxID=2844893 RepID=A0A9D8KE05_9DELT|nr:UDP-N-acetylglucosamine 2-epimerase (hydrolyzing) [Candidatus Zymogenus saltonus]